MSIISQIFVVFVSEKSSKDLPVGLHPKARRLATWMELHWWYLVAHSLAIYRQQLCLNLQKSAYAILQSFRAIWAKTWNDLMGRVFCRVRSCNSLRALNICPSLTFPLRFFQVFRWLANAPCKSVAWCLLGERLWSQINSNSYILNLENLRKFLRCPAFSHWGCNVQLLIDLLFGMSAGWTFWRSDPYFLVSNNNFLNGIPQSNSKQLYQHRFSHWNQGFFDLSIRWSPGSMVCRASNRRSDARSTGTKECRSLAVISDCSKNDLWTFYCLYK